MCSLFSSESFFVNSSQNAPKLTRPNYYTRPALAELKAYSDDQLSHVRDFAVGCKEFGEVVFPGDSDVRGLDLDSIIVFGKKMFLPYKECEPPGVGEELNKHAIVTLFNVWKLDRATQMPTTDPQERDVFARKLREATEQMNVC